MKDRYASELAWNRKQHLVVTSISSLNLFFVALGVVSLAAAMNAEALHPILALPSVHYSLIAIGVVGEAIMLPQLIRIPAQRRKLEEKMRKAHDQTSQSG